MYRHIFIATLVALAVAAPAPEPKPLALISALKTPASTAKLTPLAAPLAAPLASPIIAPISHITYAAPGLPQIAQYAYPYSGPLVAAAPASYSIEQHGYNIVY